MSDYKSSDAAGAGSPNLAHVQYLQDNWGVDQVAASVQVEKIELSSISGTAGITTTNIPVGSEILDVEVQCSGTNGSGTARLSVGGGGANITDAIIMAVVDVVTKADTIDQTYKFVTADGVTVTTNADADEGDVYVYYKKQV